METNYELARLARDAFAALGALGSARPGERALHAKGTLCSASFTATPDAAGLSRAPHLRGDTIRAHVRFSNGAGDPGAPDFESREGRGMAIKLYLPGGTTTDVVAVSLPVFFVRDPRSFLELLHARVPDPATGELDPEKIGAFLGAHPEALPAVEAVLTARPPESYLRTAYNSLHAYGFVDADGELRYGRYFVEPDAGAADLDPDDARARGADYLQADLAARLGERPATFTLAVQLASEGDPIDDPTVAWSDDRERIAIGRIEVTGLAFDRERDGDVLVFDPTRVTDGIELTDDEILHFRAHAYAESVLNRSGVARA